MIDQSAESKPYRWGKFQGWAMVVVGAFFVLVAACTFLLPNSHAAQALVSGFFEGQGNTEMLRRLQSREVGEYTYIGGWLAGAVLLTLGSGVGILKKRMFAFVFVLFLIVRALTTVSIASLAFWAGSMPYYYKRRHEFRTP